MWADPVVTRYIGGFASTPSQTWMRMLGYPGLWAFLGFGYWAVEEVATGAFIGEMGFADFKRDLFPSIAGVPELGWAFAAPAHGKGYATEAVREALRWADERLFQATVCIINAANSASVRVAQKCGYREIQRITPLDSEVILYSREPSPDILDEPRGLI